MFGYIIANTDDLSEKEQARYQQAYCGLCHELGKRHGQLSRLSLNYDMTFLILLLFSLYEPSEEQGSIRCIIHPTKNHPFCRNCYTEYAADMTIALSYYKCMDDWKDDHKVTGRFYAAAIEKEYLDVKMRWPRQCRTIESCLQELEKIEEGEASSDKAANCFGRLMAELFVYQEDLWEKSLRQFGNCLGRFIYMMDAVMDYESDKKKGNYNPIVSAGKTPDDVHDAMTIQIGMAAEIFEKLPLVEDVHLLRSVIYAGVWQKYLAKSAKKGE